MYLQIYIKTLNSNNTNDLNEKNCFYSIRVLIMRICKASSSIFVVFDDILILTIVRSEAMTLINESG